MIFHFRIVLKTKAFQRNNSAFQERSYKQIIIAKFTFLQGPKEEEECEWLYLSFMMAFTLGPAKLLILEKDRGYS